MAVMQREKYKWDGDSRDERESEFTETGFSTTTSGTYHSTWAQERARRRRKARLGAWLWPLLIASALGVVALYFGVTSLRG